MGRIKTSFIKNIGKDLVERHPEKFTSDFSKNKGQIDELISVKSKKMRNIITGYVTTLKKQQLRSRESQ
jgi:small subunit ribosomal protein S17e